MSAWELDDWQAEPPGDQVPGDRADERSGHHGLRGRRLVDEPAPMVLATAVPAKAPMKLKAAAMRMA